MIGYRYLGPAETEAAEAALYYQDKAELGKEFLDDLEDGIKILRRSPKIGTPLGTRVRQLLLSKFPYSIIYYVHEESIIIAAVAHHKRKPNYWRDRVDGVGH